MLKKFICFFLMIAPVLLSQPVSPSFSLSAGFYNAPVQIYLTSVNSKAIFYTTDGSTPTSASNLYTSPVQVDSTTVLRAVAAESDSIYSEAVTNTYFINENTELPVFSISTNAENLWDTTHGIYTNYNQNREIPVHLEFFETNRKRELDMDAGAKIHGEGSRGFPQKSLVISARKIYGSGKISYKFFDDSRIDKFESIILRNSGSDWNRSMFRDPIVNEFTKGMDLDISGYRPSIAFLNGVYWGIHNIREKTDEHYLESHHNINPDSVDISFYWGIQPSIGVNGSFQKLLQYADKDLTRQENYDTIKTKMDVPEFINYFLTEVYFDNTDWPPNNAKEWKAWGADKKWRWILYDTDASLDYKLRESYKHPSLTYSTSPMGIDFGNPPFSTRLVTSLLKNSDFRTDFINRFADLANTKFTKEVLLEILQRFKRNIESEIERHFNRWKDSVEIWYRHLDAISVFVSERYPYIKQDFMNKFSLAGSFEITLNVNDANVGFVKLNTINISDFPWKGEYFSGIPIKAAAVPFPGYSFKGWERLSGSDSIFTFSSDISLTAIFEKKNDFQNIVINEINYNSAPAFDVEDWFELYNASGLAADLSGWIFKDSDDSHSYTFPLNTVIAPDEYLIVCRDTIKFSSFFPQVKNFLGNLDFGLNNGGEKLRLYNANNEIIDSLTYDDKTPWPPEADGSGKTLELINSKMNNAIASSWGISLGYGTPGRQNDSYSIVKADALGKNYTFDLSQNYPNPFNPTTKIKFTIPDSPLLSMERGRGEVVSLRVYDILGNEVAILINEEKPAGEYEVEFNASKFSSGIYFYQLKAGSNIKANKMILMK